MPSTPSILRRSLALGRRASVGSAVLALALLGSCASAVRDEQRPSEGALALAPPRSTATVQRADLPAPRLPQAGGTFAHSQVRIAGAPRAKAGEAIADVEQCAQCHTDAAEQWRTSAHAFASFNNPVYRASILKFREARGAEKSQFCGGCHDVALLVDGAMKQEIEPSDARAHAGITCGTCHGISEVRADGNGSYNLRLSDAELPKPGDAGSVLRHRASVAQSPLRTANLCVTCHRSFLNDDSGNADRHLIGQDDATPWARSVFGGSLAARVDEVVAEKDCKACHMTKEPAVNRDPGAKDGQLASHRFTGGHSWLANMRSDKAQLARIEAFMRSAVTLDVAAVVRADGQRLYGEQPIALTAGERVAFDVVVKNELVGHRFPGGVMDAADTWLEVRVVGERGVLFTSGLEHEKGVEDPEGDETHVFTSHMAQGDGTRKRARETQDFKANVFNHTIPPREAAVVRYAFEVPTEQRGLRVIVKLRHRARTLQLQQVACNEYRTERGRAFGQGGLKNVAKNLNPCAPQPVLDLATAEYALGEGQTRPRTFRNYFAHAQGLLRSLQEHAWEAREPYERALALAATPRERAMAYGGLAQLAAREGDRDLTFVMAEKAEADAPRHPALARSRAEVLLSQWKWSDAADHLQLAAQSSPRDDGLLASLAVALGGAGRAVEAYDVAQRGLLLQPRDWDMLRVASLSLEATGNPSESARDAFLQVRTPDDAPGIRGKCSKNVHNCALERNPVHTHMLRRASR